jgi:hypothetical protein
MPFPEEILREICYHLNWKTFHSFRLANKQFRSIGAEFNNFIFLEPGAFSVVLRDYKYDIKVPKLADLWSYIPFLSVLNLAMNTVSNLPQSKILQEEKNRGSTLLSRRLYPPHYSGFAVPASQLQWDKFFPSATITERLKNQRMGVAFEKVRHLTLNQHKFSPDDIMGVIKMFPRLDSLSLELGKPAPLDILPVSRLNLINMY